MKIKRRVRIILVVAARARRQSWRSASRQLAIASTELCLEMFRRATIVLRHGRCTPINRHTKSQPAR